MLWPNDAIAPTPLSLGATDEVSLGEIESLDFVALEPAEEKRFVDHDDRRKADDRADELRDALPLDFEERRERRRPRR
jgi:hypothetical protein